MCSLLDGYFKFRAQGIQPVGLTWGPGASVPSHCYLFTSAICLLLPRIMATSQRRTSSLWASLCCWQLVLLRCHKMEASGTAWGRGSSPNCRRSSRFPSEAYSRCLLWLGVLNQSVLPPREKKTKKHTLLVLFLPVVAGSRPDEASFSSGSLQARSAEGGEDREARCSATQRA